MSVFILSCLLSRLFVNNRWVVLPLLIFAMITSIFVVATMFEAMAELLT